MECIFDDQSHNPIIMWFFFRCLGLESNWRSTKLSGSHKKHYFISHATSTAVKKSRVEKNVICDEKRVIREIETKQHESDQRGDTNWWEIGWGVDKIECNVGNLII